MGDAVGHLPAGDAAEAELPLVAFLEKAADDVQVLEVPDVVGEIGEIVRAVRPDARCQPAKGAVFHRHVGEDDVVGGFVGEEADAEADLADGVVLVVLVVKRIVEVTVLDPEIIPIGRADGIFRVDAGHAAVEFDADDFISGLVDEVNATPILRVVESVNERFVPRAVGADVNRIARRAAALGLKFLAPCVAAFQQNGVARVQCDARGLRECLPGRGAGEAVVRVVARRLAHVVSRRRCRRDVQLDLVSRRLDGVGKIRILRRRENLAGAPRQRAGVGKDDVVANSEAGELLCEIDLRVAGQREVSRNDHRVIRSRRCGFDVEIGGVERESAIECERAGGRRIDARREMAGRLRRHRACHSAVAGEDGCRTGDSRRRVSQSRAAEQELAHIHARCARVAARARERECVRAAFHEAIRLPGGLRNATVDGHISRSGVEGARAAIEHEVVGDGLRAGAVVHHIAGEIDCVAIQSERPGIRIECDAGELRVVREVIVVAGEPRARREGQSVPRRHRRATPVCRASPYQLPAAIERPAARPDQRHHRQMRPVHDGGHIFHRVENDHVIHCAIEPTAIHASDTA